MSELRKEWDHTADVEKVITDEKKYLAGHTPPERWTGLAFSSGGLRASAFSLGVARALSEARQLEKYHYLSGVGGGALTSGFIAWLQGRGASQAEAGTDPNLIDAREPPLVTREAVNYLKTHASGIGSHSTTAGSDDGSLGAAHTVRGLPIGVLALLHAARPFFVYGSLLVAVFFLLSFGDAALTLFKPALYLLSRLDLWSSIVDALNFGLVCCLVTLLLLLVRVIFTPLFRAVVLAFRGPINQLLPPVASSFGRGVGWFIAVFFCGLLAIMAIFSTGIWSKLALLTFAPLAVLSFVHYKTAFNIISSDGATSSKARAWAALLPVFFALISALASSLALFFYLLKAGVTPPGEAVYMSPGLELFWGTTALFVSILCLMAMPAQLNLIRKRWHLIESPSDRYKRTQQQERHLSLALRWVGIWFALGSVVGLQRLYAYLLPNQVVRFVLLMGVLVPGVVWFTWRTTRQARAPELSHDPFRSLWARSYCVILVYATLMTAHSIAWGLLDSSYPQSILFVIALALVIGQLSDNNFYGLTGLYRKRVGEAFLPLNQSNQSWHFAARSLDWPLAASHSTPQANNRPLLLLNCSLETTHSTSRKRRKRGADSYTLSPLWCGSVSTGFRKTSRLSYKPLTLLDAMVISSLDLAPGGQNPERDTLSRRAAFALLTLLGLRNGYYLAHPGQTFRFTNTPNLLRPGLSALLQSPGHAKNDRYICLQAGRYFDELGLYELFRRRLDLILVSDATCAAHQGRAFLNTLERAQSDFEIEVSLLPRSKLAGTTASSEHNSSSYQVLQIVYPAAHDEPRKLGTLIRITPVLALDLSFYLQSYAALHQNFPHAMYGTIIDDETFTAYEELGHHLAQAAISEISELNRSSI